MSVSRPTYDASITLHMAPMADGMWKVGCLACGAEAHHQVIALGLIGRGIQHGGGILDVDVFRQAHPAFAAGIGRAVGNGDGIGEAMGAHQQEEEGIFRPVVQAHLGEFVRPDMAGGHGLELAIGFDAEDIGDIGEGFQLNAGGFRPGGFDQVVGLFLEHDLILMEKSGEQEEAAEFHFKLAAGFVDAAFAEKGDLASLEKRLADTIPFFQGHGKIFRIQHGAEL